MIQRFAPLALACLTTIAFAAHAQVATIASPSRASGRMSVPADLDAFSRDVQSVVGMSQRGNSLYDGDPNKREWGNYCGIARSNAERGEFRAAVREASKALHLGSVQGNVNASAFAARDLAIAYSWAGDLERGQIWAERALDFAKRMSSGVDVDYQIRYDVLRTLGDIAFRRGQYQAAIEKYQDASKKLPFIGAGTFKETIALAIANTQSQLGLPEAELALVEMTKSGDNDVKMMAQRILTIHYLSKGKLDESKKSAIRLAELAATSKNDYESSWALFFTARALDKSGQAEQAIAAAVQAVEKLERVRAGFVSKEIKSSLFGNNQEIFEFAAQLLATNNRWQEAFEVSEKSRARTTLDILRKTSSVPAGTNAPAKPAAPPITTLSAKALNAAQIIRLLPSQTALVSYMVLTDRVLMWRVDQSGVVGASVLVDRESLRKNAQDFRLAIEQENSRKTQELAQSLYQLLVQPLKLATEQAVIVAPHSMLHFVPFQALKSDKGWWIEERAITYAVSGSALPEADKSMPLSAALQKVIALGNPDVNNSKLDLPGATTEIENIKTLYPSTQIFTRKEASKQRVMAQGESAGVLHIAAHALVDDIDPMHSYVLLSNSQSLLGATGGELEAKDMQSLKLQKTSLVTLSACNSGIGKIAGGDEFAGFKTAVLMAGAPRLMVSLWPVDDNATASLMSNFYKSASSLSSAQAIRQAQLGLIRNKDTSSPFMWAPFVLVGDPR